MIVTMGKYLSNVDYCTEVDVQVVGTQGSLIKTHMKGQMADQH